jgi:hypothetical protein
VSIVTVIGGAASAYAGRGSNLLALAQLWLGPAALAGALAARELGRGGEVALVALVHAAFVLYTVGLGRATADGATGYVSPLALWRAARPRAWTAVTAGLILGAAVGAGLQLRLLPGLLLIGLAWPCGAIVARERCGPLEALGRCLGLVRHDLLATLALGTGAAGLVAGAYLAALQATAVLGEPASSALALAAAVSLVGPLASLAFLRAHELKRSGARLSLRLPARGTVRPRAAAS